jgi:CheY-like chemotaxis protein
VRDVTDKRRAQEALGENEELLRSAQKMEAIGRLAGGVAHDFNNLLTVVITCADKLARSGNVAASSVPLVKEIALAGERGAELTRQLLTFARRRPRQTRNVGLEQAVIGVESMLRRLIGDNVVLETRLDAGARTTVCADPAQIEQLLVNLVLNARDALGDRGGRISVRTAREGAEVVLKVKDDGCGMTDEVKAHLFEPFFTTKPRGHGTGLGLATVYGIVHQSGGRITVRSETGRGSTFEVRLPSAGDAVHDDAPRSDLADPIAAPSGSEKILVVEDEAPLRRLVRSILDEAGYQVIEASNGDEAVCACDASTALVLSDVVMPGMNGRALVERLREAWPGLRALLMSGYDETRASEGEPMIAKPFTGVALVRRVRQVLDS